MKNRIVWLLLALAVLIGGFYWYKTKEKATETNTIKIGANLPLTGYVGNIGESVREGINMRLEELKDSITVSGVSIEIDFQDNKGEAKDAVNILQKQLINKPDIYMSGITQQTMAVIGQVEDQKVPHFLWSFTPLELNKYKNVYRTLVNFGVEADYYKKFIALKKPSKVAIVRLNILGAQEQFQEKLIPWMIQGGIKKENILEESYDVPESNFKNIATKIKNFKPDVLLVEGFKSHLINIISDFRAYNLLLNENAMFSFDLIEAKESIDKKNLEGLYFTAPYIEYADDKDVISWKDSFRNSHKKEPDYINAFAYDLGYVFYLLSKEKKANSKYNLQEAMMKVDFKGVTGNVSFNNDGELKYNLALCKFIDGKIVKQPF